MTKKNKTIIVLISLSVLLSLFFIFVWAANNGEQNTSKPQEKPLEKDANDSSLQDRLKENNQAILAKIDSRQAIVFGLYGTDEQAGDAGRSDIIMVISYNPETRKCVMVSLPRDLRVDIPGYGLDKINHAYAYGGRALIDQTIEELLGLSLDFSIKVDFETFAKVIDDFSGVLVNAQKDFPYNDGSIAIKQGQQVLDGRQALFYVRFRSDRDGDFGRIARQQEVVISLLNQVSELGLKKIDELVNNYYNQGIESNASLSTLEEYVNLSSRDQAITFENYRFETRSQVIDGLWYELYNQEDLEAIKTVLIQNQ